MSSSPPPPPSESFARARHEHTPDEQRPSRGERETTYPVGRSRRNVVGGVAVVLFARRNAFAGRPRPTAAEGGVGVGRSRGARRYIHGGMYPVRPPSHSFLHDSPYHGRYGGRCRWRKTLRCESVQARLFVIIASWSVLPTLPRNPLPHQAAITFKRHKHLNV